MRTAPTSNHVFSCEYDDTSGNGTGEVDRDASMGSDDGDQDPEGKKKKKRKTSTVSKRKNKKNEEDEETELLRKKIGASNRIRCEAGVLTILQKHSKRNSLGVTKSLIAEPWTNRLHSQLDSMRKSSRHRQPRSLRCSPSQPLPKLPK